MITTIRIPPKRNARFSPQKSSEIQGSSGFEPPQKLLELFPKKCRNQFYLFCTTPIFREKFIFVKTLFFSKKLVKC
jgi:hypothetical protein